MNYGNFGLRLSRPSVAFVALALGCAPASGRAQTLLAWDPGGPGGTTIQAADGIWTLGGDALWTSGAATPVVYTDSFNVIFRDSNSPSPSAPVTITVTVEGTVAPGEIEFDQTGGEDTNFVLLPGASGGTIGEAGGQIDITMEDAARIDTALAGSITIEGDDTLSLGGDSAGIEELAVALNADLVFDVGAGQADGLTTVAVQDLNIAGTLTMRTGVTVTLDAAGGGDTLVVFGGELAVEEGAVLVSEVSAGLGSSGIVLGGQITGDVSLASSSSLTTSSNAAVILGTLTAANTSTSSTPFVTVFAGDRLTVDSGAADATTPDVVIGENARLNVGGTLLASVEIEEEGELRLNGGTLGASAAPIELVIDGEATMAGRVFGNITVGATGEVDLRIGGLRWDAGQFLSDGTVNVLAGVTTGSDSERIINRGELNFGTGSRMNARVRNEGTLTVDDTAHLAGGLTLTASGEILMNDGFADDVLTITGNTNFEGGTIFLDANLGAVPGVDRITVNGEVSGNLILAFDLINVRDFAELPDDGIVVLSYDTQNAFSVGSTGLGTVGGIIYQIRDVDSSIRIVSLQNPNIGALAGTVTLTESLIGSVINRPSSPFVTGLAGEEVDPCTPGVWARATGGGATASGRTTADNAGQPLIYDGEVSASYYGIQAGGDFSCVDGRFFGWDVSYGGILGVNLGSTEQPVFAFDPALGVVVPDQIISNTSTDFTQAYGGLYLSAVKGNVLLDLQYRAERTSFDMTNDGTGDERVGIVDQTFESKAQTLSGSVSYVFALNRERRISFVPTAGFALTKISTDPIVFEDDDRLEVDDATIQVGFVGGSFAMTNIRPSGNAALTYFATGTVYQDFADPIRSVYYESPTATGTESFSSNLGTYGEASIGVNYTRLLDKGFLGGRQLNASIRLDKRFGSTLDSWGVTGQVRLQF